MALTKQTDHKTAALNRRAQEFRKASKLTSILDVLCTEIQAIEDATWQLYTLRDIDAGTGVQLDMIGEKVGQTRGTSANDAEYRLRLRARIRANTSSGTANEVLAVFRALLPIGRFELLSQPESGFVLRILDNSVTATQATVFKDFLKAAKSAGVRAILEWINGLDTATMYTALGSTLLGAATAGNDFLLVQSTAVFPRAGTVIIDAGLAIAETRTYTDKNASYLLGVQALANNHALKAAVSYAGADALGLGFGTTANPALGGELASAGEKR